MRTPEAAQPNAPSYAGLIEDGGVLLASAGATLRYRAGTGDWLPVTGDVALVPDAAAELEVRRQAGGIPTRLDI